MRGFPKTLAFSRLLEEGIFFHNTQITLAVLACFAAVCVLLVTGDGNMSALLFADSFFNQGSSHPVFSGEGLEGGAQLVKDNIAGVGIIEEGNIIQTIIFIIRYVLIFAGILALFAFIWAGVLYITTFMNEENTETAKKVMMYAAIGILLIIFSWVIVDFLTTFDFN